MGVPELRHDQPASAGAGSAVRWCELGEGVRAGFTGRLGGVSKPPYATLNLGLRVGDEMAAVTANRAAVAAACGLAPDRYAWMCQVHGVDVARLGHGLAEPAGPADGMVTDVPGLALAVLAADCVPVLLADPAARIAGVAHAGREGMAAGIVPAVVAAMIAAGARPAGLRVLIGPAICGGCYEVPDDMQARISAVVPASRCRTRRGTAGLDLRAGIKAQLAAAGVGRVDSDERCTAECADLFSYRRDGRTGRFAGLVWLA